MRDKFMNTGLDSFADHEILELLLFYSNRRRDTNPTAHRLIERFGSLNGVLEAPVGELMSVEGVGDAAATLISLVPQISRRYMQGKNEAEIECVTDSQMAAAYLMPRFLGITVERFAILCLDSKSRVINFNFITEGSLKHTHIDMKAVAQAALSSNAASVILAHNHPGASALPSRDDVAATKQLVELLNGLDISVDDHIIICDEEYYSMRSNEKFESLFSRFFTCLAPKTSFVLS